MAGLISCIGKARFAGFGMASTVARRMRQRDMSKNAHPYACKFCGGFHIGSKVAKSGRDAKKRPE